MVVDPGSHANQPIQSIVPCHAIWTTAAGPGLSHFLFVSRQVAWRPDPLRAPRSCVVLLCCCVLLLLVRACDDVVVAAATLITIVLSCSTASLSVSHMKSSSTHLSHPLSLTAAYPSRCRASMPRTCASGRNSIHLFFRIGKLRSKGLMLAMEVEFG